MKKKIRIRIGDREFTASLNESETATLFFDLLPVTISMQRWGDEYYGDCGLSVSSAPDSRQDIEPGELAIWPAGSALCIFFGRTPASTSEKPRAISPVNPIGSLDGPSEWLKSLGGTVTAEVETV
ncbi:MAG: hypothetical protein JXQ30_03300 [Spirochaetes bacterium]|nr:hypothetical protein [Spirochaetota bacterium]